MEARADRDRHVDDVRPGQQLAERQHLGELVGGQPAAPLDQHEARPGQHAAEGQGGDAHEAEIELGRARAGASGAVDQGTKRGDGGTPAALSPASRLVDPGPRRGVRDLRRIALWESRTGPPHDARRRLPGQCALAFALSLVLAALLGPDAFGRYAIGLSIALVINTVLFEWLRLSTRRFQSQRTQEREPVHPPHDDLAYRATACALGGRDGRRARSSSRPAGLSRWPLIAALDLRHRLRPLRIPDRAVARLLPGAQLRRRSRSCGRSSASCCRAGARLCHGRPGVALVGTALCRAAADPRGPARAAARAARTRASTATRSCGFARYAAAAGRGERALPDHPAAQPRACSPGGTASSRPAISRS